MADVIHRAYQLDKMRLMPFSVCIFGVISHVFLFIAFIKDPLKCFKNSGTYLVENLAVSDFLTCCIAPFLLYFTNKWYWIYIQFITHATVSASLYTIASISIDRFLIVVYPLKHRVFLKGKVIAAWLACLWLFCCAIPVKISIPSKRGNPAIATSTVLVQIAPILFSSVMYAVTYNKLKKQSRNLALENISHRQQQARILREKQFLRTIILIACIAFACIVPSAIDFIYRLFQNLSNENQDEQALRGVFFGIFYLNYAINPLVYVLRLPNYRKTFYLLYCCNATRW